MKFKRANEGVPSIRTAQHYPKWRSEHGGWCLITASDHEIVLEFRDPGPRSAWIMTMPFEINIGEKGLTAFVVRGIMDALAPVADEPNRKTVYKAIQAYLDELCPPVEDEDDSKRTFAQWKEDAGEIGDILIYGLERRRYYIHREDVRRYLSNHADCSEPETEQGDPE